MVFKYLHLAMDSSYDSSPRETNEKFSRGGDTIDHKDVRFS